MDSAINILTMKWGTLYSADDVNRLAAQVRLNLTRPYRFICFTDDATGLSQDVEPMPLPELGLPEGNTDTRWRKLALFQRDLYGIKGTALFLDLDLIVTGNLDPFFDLPGRFRIIRDDDLFRPKPLRRINRKRDQFLHMVGNTSVFRFEIGAHAEILDDYRSSPAEASILYEHEQQMVSDILHRQGLLEYWPRGLCVSFKNDCVGRGLGTYMRDPVQPPNARIVLFAGNPKMDAVMSGRGSTFYRKIGKIDWLRSAWLAED